MAANGTNGDSAAVLDEIKAPAGVVLPPREIRNILEKTAGYVARNGAVFEDRIRDKENGNPKFSFLNPEDAYHQYYQWRLVEVRAGRGTDIAAGSGHHSPDGSLCGKEWAPVHDPARPARGWQPPISIPHSQPYIPQLFPAHHRPIYHIITSRWPRRRRWQGPRGTDRGA
ncbi:hypothetical protein RirG_011750 [Rhizophagus irregularis DAOM 197198w]|uniref:SURP motif domain-containing protein n=1 Tax=Rhizophagus irregularis (strain DAOM 197198w) TaxID=1432141 RepID=A0A015LGK7_RHIIW|nr:hypothetical protein RirG_011750 [Rhizophagus irregularis DAOM 197198w]